MLIGSIAAAFVVIRYRIPDLARKVKALETENPTNKDMAHVAETVKDLAKKIEELEDLCPSMKDLDTVVDSFRTVCKFNQVTCQKGNAVQMGKVKQDLEGKLAGLYTLVNNQAILMARVDERVAAILLNHNNVNHNDQPAANCKNGKFCLFKSAAGVLEIGDAKGQ